MSVFLQRVRSAGRVYYYIVIERPGGPPLRVSLLRALRCLGVDPAVLLVSGSGRGPGPERPSDGGEGLGPTSFFKERLGLRLTKKLLEEFRAWCGRTASENTCNTYIKLIMEIDSGERTASATRWHATAYKRFLRFLCQEKGLARACEEHRRAPIIRSRPDLRLPSDEAVRRALATDDPELATFYRVLAESGLRAVEAARLLAEGPGGCVRLGGYYRCPILWSRGTKRALWAYVLEPPPRLPELSLSRLKRRRTALDLPPFKYIRKWVATKMLLAGMSEIAVDFVQGRVPESVLRKHYADRLALADREYGKYAAWLRRFMEG